MAVPFTLSSVPAQTPYVQYVSGSGQTVFPYPFEITQDSDLVVMLGTVVQPTDSGYSLTGQGSTNGGNVTFTVGLTAGTIVTLYRNISISRITQLSQNGTFFSSNFNNEFNRIYLIMQQLQQSLLPGGNQAYALMVPNSNNPAPTTLLTPANYAGKYLSFDSNGNPQPAALTSSGAITSSLLAPFIGYGQSAAESAAGVVPTSEAWPTTPYHDIRRYGFVGNGSTDDSSAWGKLALVIGAGGSGYVPPGPTMVKSQVTIAAPANPISQRVVLSAYGVELYTTGAIYALTVTGGSLGGLDIVGLTHVNTTDSLALGGINLSGTQNCRVIGCWTEVSTAIGASASYGAVILQPSDPTNDNTGAFWNKVIDCGVRASSGNNCIEYGVLILGACNATVVRGGNYSSCVNGVGILNQIGGSNTGTLANAVVICENAFEGNANSINGVFVNGQSSAASGANITGLRIYGNRGESLTNFVSFNNFTEDSPVPPFIFGNYLVSSVSNYVVNGSSITICTLDPSVTPAWGLAAPNTWLRGNGTWRFDSIDSTHDAVVAGAQNSGSGFGLYNGTTRLASLRMRTGGGAYMDAPGGLFLRDISSISASSTEAKNLRGTASFSSGTTVAVSFGTAESDSSYYITLSGNAAGYCWVTSKGTGGFTINCSNSNSNSVDWILVR